MVVNADKVFWGFLFYVRENPYKSVEDMNWDDLYEMAKLFAVVNTTSATLTAATAQSDAQEGFGVVDFSTDVDFPKYAAATRTAADGAGLDASTTVAANRLLCAQAMYPERGI